MQYIIIIFLVILSPQILMANETQEPAIQEVQRMALDYAKIRPSDLSDMKRRSRLAAALPKLQIGAKKTFDNDIDIALSDNVSVTSSGVNIGPETTNMQQNLTDNTAIEVKAVWSLNELVYNQDMLAITEEARYQIRERRQILSEVNKLFFEWQRLKNELPGRLKTEEVIADLDALTGGWFSNQIK